MAYMSLDPSITLLNYQICGEKYKAMTRWFSGYEVTAEELNQPFPFISEEQKLSFEEVAANRSGVKVIFNREKNLEQVASSSVDSLKEDNRGCRSQKIQESSRRIDYIGHAPPGLTGQGDEGA